MPAKYPHNPTLFSHPEEEDAEDGWSSRSYSGSRRGSTPGRNRSRHHRIGGTPHSLLGPPPNSEKHSDLYSQWMTRYRSSGDNSDDPRDDPDSHFFQRNVDQLADTGDSDKEDLSRHDPESTLNLKGLMIDPAAASEKDKERLEWRAMLVSVLSGNILKSEKRRIASAMESSENEQKQVGERIFLGIRARFSGRTDEEEKKKLAERRLRIVDPIIDQVLKFVVEPPDPGETIHEAAFRQASLVLHRLDIAYSLYPTIKDFCKERPQAAETSFQDRIDALQTWCNATSNLQYYIRYLQRWVGSKNIDVTAHNTSTEQPLTLNASAPNGTSEVADTSSFIERLLKEEPMQRTFEKRTLSTIHHFLSDLRDSQIALFSLFQEMKLPTFEAQLLPLLSFPRNLARAALGYRIQYADRLGARPDNLIIDQTLEDLRVAIGLACTLKRQYVAFKTPDPDNRWRVPPCLPEDYDSTVLEGLRCLFKVISAKLRVGKKAIYFKETDLLESYWATFNDVSQTVSGGSHIVAEQLCSLINRLILRVTNYFDTQLRVPGGQTANGDPESSANPGDSQRKMTHDQVVTWYSRILESVRLRYRKLQRFTRVLTQRFCNSAEYSLEGVPFELFVQFLADSGHFLVLTRSFEENAVYIVASARLADHEDRISKILHDAFHVEDDSEGLPTEEEESGEDYDEAEYILVLTPETQFYWKGAFVQHEMEYTDLEIKENRVRLISYGAEVKLSLAKRTFTSLFAPAESEDEEPMGPLISPLVCVSEQLAHLPSVNRELRKIARSTNKLAELIADSVQYIRSSLHSSPVSQELLENWYLFASDHGTHAIRHMERPVATRFNNNLIKLAISWVTFICDDCDPNDSQTFKWAVNALEFALSRTKRNILELPDEQFEMLRQKVSNCMTLLISHFDILGARGNFQASMEKRREEELMRARVSQHEELDEHELHVEPDDIFAYTDSSTRLFWDRFSKAVDLVEHERVDLGQHNRIVGRVLDKEMPEDRSLIFLATSSSNVSIKWQQGQFIGSGAFGSVYRAVNMDTGSIMAVKEVKFQELAGVPNLHAQIKDELRVMEVLHHPNVVEYYGIEVHRDKVYIFEEYCQGGSLAALLEHGRIEDERIMQVYTMQLLDGLIYLHSQGVVHRDIKPDNILLDAMGVLKYVDFGAAKIFARNTRTMQRTRRFSTAETVFQPEPFSKHNSLTGTPMYMSPEVIKNDSTGRFGAMDIWSLGCVVLECATGKKPWSNLDNEWAIMFHIGVATQHPPLPEPGQLSDMGIDFIKRCLTINAHTRPTAVELMDDLWILDFKEALASLEEAEQEGNVAELAADETFEQAAVARAALLHPDSDTGKEYFATPIINSPNSSEEPTP